MALQITGRPFPHYWGLIALLGLTIVQAGFVFLVTPPGYLSIDEVTYHLMARDLSKGHGFLIDNGYEDAASEELESMQIRARNGRLVSQYPYGFPLLAQPFYRMLGYRGLFLLNAVAFVALLLLTYGIATTIFGDWRLSLGACAILGLATFAWEYSQASWPHMTSAALILAAWACVLHLDRAEGPLGVLWAVAGGVCAGLAVSVRLDGAFALPAIALAYLLSGKLRWLDGLAFVAGVAPGLAFLGWSNLHKFGTALPFSYGMQAGRAAVGSYFPIAVVGLVGVAIAVVFIKSEFFLGRYKRGHLIAAGLVGIGVLFLLPFVRAVVANLALGAYQILIDLRIRDPNITEPGLARSAGGALVYLGGLKKSLTQSLPYLPLLLLPLVELLRNESRRIALLRLFLIPGAYGLVFSYLAWHGGMCLNQRYLLPTLPFVAILCAYALRRLWALGVDRVGADRGTLWLGGLLGVMAFLIFWRAGSPSWAEGYLLGLPLVAAAILCSLMLASAWRPNLSTGRLTSAVLLVAGLSLAWAGMVAFFYDYPWAQRNRMRKYALTQAVAPHIKPHSLVFTDFGDALYGLMEIDGVRIALPWRDGFDSFDKLAEHHLAMGRPVFLAFHGLTWKFLAEQRFADRYHMVLVMPGPNFRLVRIQLLEPN